MAGFQDALDNIAKVVGGSQPDAANRPRWFSGDQVGDSTGLQVLYGPSFKGCYSAPVEAPQDYPIGIVMPGSFEVGGPQNRDVLWQGDEYNLDTVQLIIALSKVDLETDFYDMVQYRDLVPTAFASHLTAFSTASGLQIWSSGGRPRQITWAGTRYNAIEFDIKVIRWINRTYSG